MHETDAKRKKYKIHTFKNKDGTKGFKRKRKNPPANISPTH